ncbi:MAG: transcriptional regulator [Sporocytophaga sp.]|uniref:transcriptional regulator n=1 Tax=Sporocytophaga sp. TaxID=2231183 RepID=UPI001B0D3723|nr:transcriptional regulator [Sporocytophaga sp.]MBO9703365.1 transcriptional regulator [Sporocytophaga sp.]
MEKIKFDKDIKVFYVNAKSFPEGIQEAHQKLHSLITFSKDRKYFGVSRPEQGGEIVYRAAAEELESGEAEKLHLETLVLKKGEYVSITIKDFAKDIMSIDRAFKELLALPDLDPQGYCVEWYYNEKDVNCMIRLK